MLLHINLAEFKTERAVNCPLECNHIGQPTGLIEAVVLTPSKYTGANSFVRYVELKTIDPGDATLYHESRPKREADGRYVIYPFEMPGFPNFMFCQDMMLSMVGSGTYLVSLRIFPVGTAFVDEMRLIRTPSSFRLRSGEVMVIKDAGGSSNNNEIVMQTGNKPQACDPLIRMRVFCMKRLLDRHGDRILDSLWKPGGPMMQAGYRKIVNLLN